MEVAGTGRIVGAVSRCSARILVLGLVASLAACGSSRSAPPISSGPHRAATNAPVVLGSKHLVTFGIGWGSAHPRLIFNGGDPSGGARHLKWRSWGAPVAYARGLAVISRPGGNFYPKLGRIELRAWRLGRCTQRGPRAYTRLLARVAVPPGGPLTRWAPWSGWRSICKFSPRLKKLWTRSP